MANNRNLPARFDEQMRAKAALYKGTVAAVSQGQFISFRGGILAIDQSPIPGNKLEVVVLDFILCNTFYPGKFDPNNPSPPSCYAFAREAAELKPHSEAKDPQHQACEGCPQNEWGSADEGNRRGKACKNGMRVAYLAWDGLTPENCAKQEMRFAQLPVTSVQGFAGFVRQCGEVLKVPPFGVVCELSVQGDTKTQFKVLHTIKDQIKDRRLLEALMHKSNEVERKIDFPFPEPQERLAHGARGVNRKAPQTDRRPSANVRKRF